MSVRFLLPAVLLLAAPPLLAQTANNDAPASGAAVSTPAVSMPPASDATVSPPAAGDAAVSDASVTAQVKSAIKKAPGLGGLPIHVTTIEGVVRLSGSVPSSVQVDEAEGVVSRVPGVKEVNNQLHSGKGS